MKNIVVVLILVLSVLAYGCSSASNDEPGSIDTSNSSGVLDTNEDTSIDFTQAPEIPPASSMQIDFSDFQSENLSRRALDANGTLILNSYTNWGYATANVVVWSTLLKVGLAVPVTAFLEAFRYDPEQQDDGSWAWQYGARIVSVLYNVRLVGQYVGDEAHWDLYVSKENDYDDFHWISGNFNLALTEGTWVLKSNPDDPRDLLSIEWERDLTNDTATITYTNIEPDGPENGGYIQYGTTTDPLYDAFYEIYKKGQDNLIEIGWSRTTKEGRVKDSNHFGDSEWHYWNDALLDME